MSTKFLTLTAAAMLSALLMVSTASAESATDPELSHDTQCKEVGARLADWAAWNAVHRRYVMKPRYYYNRMRPMAQAESAPAPAARSAAMADTTKKSGPANYTTTNVQEVGVDEADIVKTDGKFVYTLHGNEILILKSWPLKEAHIVSRTPLNGEDVQTRQVQGRQIFLNGDRLVVLSHVNEQIGELPTYDRDRAYDWNYYYWQSRQWFQATRISVYDVSERAEPRLVRHVDFEGWMQQARMIDDDVYVVSNASLNLPPSLMKEAMTYTRGMPKNTTFNNYEALEKTKKEAFEVLRRHLAKKVNRVDVLEESMPRWRHGAYQSEQVSKPKAMYRCGDVYMPTNGAQLGILSVTHVDLDRTWDARSVGVFGSGWNIYASTRSLYVAMPDYGWSYYWGWAQEQHTQGNRTVLHKFDLRGAGERPRYAASGSVQGHLLNQFSMSEWRGDLRVATTDQMWGQARPATQANNLFVLRPSGSTLEVIGEIKGLAENERIYSARMMGDKGYVVTFRQVDPLFTLDLSDPREPKVVGELKINGFSSYIHPLDANNLLTIGTDADENGRVLGAHLQIFDVSDPAKPRRSFHQKIHSEGWAWSAAQYDHKAFTFDRRTQTLAIPMQIWGHRDHRKNFTGVLLYRVSSEEGFVELGRISHRDLAEEYMERTCEKARGSHQQSYYCRNPAQYRHSYHAALSRSIIMDDYVVTLSNYGLMAHHLRRPKASVASVLFHRI